MNRIVITPQDKLFADNLQAINEIHPGAVVVTTRWKSRNGATKFGASKRVTFKDGTQKWFKSVTIRPQYRAERDRGQERLLDCDGLRYPFSEILRISVDLLGISTAHGVESEIFDDEANEDKPTTYFKALSF